MGNEQSSNAGGSSASGPGSPAPSARPPPPKPKRAPDVVERLFQASVACTDLETAYDRYANSKSAAAQDCVEGALGRSGGASGGAGGAGAASEEDDLAPLPIAPLAAPALTASKKEQGKYVHEKAVHLMLFLDTLDVSGDPALRQGRKDLLKRLHTVADKGDELAAE